LDVAALASPLGSRLLLPWWRGKVPPPHYIKKGPRERENTHAIGQVHLLMSLVHHLLHLSLSSLSHGLPKGSVGIETTPPLHAVMLWSFRIPSEAIYFRNPG
jgi:hypothetical protein